MTETNHNNETDSNIHIDNDVHIESLKVVKKEQKKIPQYRKL